MTEPSVGVIEPSVGVIEPSVGVIEPSVGVIESSRAKLTICPLNVPTLVLQGCRGYAAARA